MIDLYQAWRSGKVNRMHTMPQLHRENIAEHTWGLLFLILRIWPEAPRDFIVWAILHDAGEIAIGDIPGHVKWDLPDEAREVLEVKEKDHVAQITSVNPTITKELHILLEIFDRAEFCVSCLHEMRLGNANAAEYFERSASRVRTLYRQLEDYPEIKAVATRLIHEMRDTSVANLSRINGAPYHAFS